MKDKNYSKKKMKVNDNKSINIKHLQKGKKIKEIDKIKF
jgi:hypothetical protein